MKTAAAVLAFVLATTGALAAPPPDGTKDVSFPTPAILCDTADQLKSIVLSAPAEQNHALMRLYLARDAAGEHTCELVRIEGGNVLDSESLGVIDIAETGVQMNAWSVHLSNPNGSEGWAVWIEPVEPKKPETSL